MTKPTKADERQTVIAAQNDALLRWPEDIASRNKQVDDLRAAEKKESDAVKTAKAAAGFKNAKDLLVQRNGWMKETVSTVLTLEKMAPDARARYCRQVMKVIDDRQYVYPDLFDNGAIGLPATEPDKPLFDSTSEGQRRGGSKAEPRPAPAPAAAAPAREIPTLSLEEAQKNLDAELAKRDGKRGPEPKSLKEARAALEMAKALDAEKSKSSDAPATEEPAAAPAGDNVVSFAKQQAAANAAGEDHIRQQAAKLAADREAKERGDKPSTTTAAPPPPPMDDEPDDETVTEAAPAEKPKRGGGRKKKDAEASAAPPPPPPPTDDEDEEGDQDEGSATFPGGPPGMGAGAERRPADFTLG